MNDIELAEHLDFVDGISKAQMLILRLLLRDQPSLKSKIRQYAEELDSNPISKELSTIQFEAMKKHLLSLSQ